MTEQYSSWFMCDFDPGPWKLRLEDLICEEPFNSGSQHEIRYKEIPFGEFHIHPIGSTGFDDCLKQLRQAFEKTKVYARRPDLILEKLDTYTTIIHFILIWPPKLPDQRKMFERLDIISENLLERLDGMWLGDGSWFYDQDGHF